MQDTHSQLASIIESIEYKKDLTASGEVVYIEPALYEEVLHHKAIFEKLENELNVIAIVQWPNAGNLGDADIELATEEYGVAIMTEYLSYGVNVLDDFINLLETTVSANPKKHLAKLELQDFTRPVVHVGTSTFEFRAMRDGGTPSKIIDYCLNQQEGRGVTVNELREKLSIHGVTNIKKALKNSTFDPNKGLLRPFAEIYPNKITLHQKIELTNEQLLELKGSSVNKLD